MERRIVMNGERQQDVQAEKIHTGDPPRTNIRNLSSSLSFDINKCVT